MAARSSGDYVGGIREKRGGLFRGSADDEGFNSVEGWCQSVLRAASLLTLYQMGLWG